jgi:peptidoglycan/xylan/chitin deacetylase (PgdA/CDA1 family)
MIEHLATSTAWWTIGGGGAAICSGGALAYGLFCPNSQLFGKVIWKGDSADSKAIALTFDDGPHPDATTAILDQLAQNHIPATFFVIGAHAKRWPDLIRRMADEGHLVANHSYDHKLTGLIYRGGYWRDQIRRTNDVIEQITGDRPTLFRPPMGFKHWQVIQAARAEGMHTVNWSRRARDGVATTSKKILDRLVEPSVAGDIILLHDGIVESLPRPTEPTIEALGDLIQGLRKRDLEITRLDKLICEQISP